MKFAKVNLDNAKQVHYARDVLNAFQVEKSDGVVS